MPDPTLTDIAARVGAPAADRRPDDGYDRGGMASVGALSLYAAMLRGELEGDEALQASQHIFELVLNSVHHAIWWKDANSVFLGCNRKLAEYAGSGIRASWSARRTPTALGAMPSCLEAERPGSRITTAWSWRRVSRSSACASRSASQAGG